MLASSYAPIALDAWQSSGLTDEIDDQFDAGRSALARIVGTQPDPSIAVLDPTIARDSLRLGLVRGPIRHGPWRWPDQVRP